MNAGLSKISHDINVISEYTAANALSLYVRKSNDLILGSNSNVNQNDLHDLPLISINSIDLLYESNLS